MSDPVNSNEPETFNIKILPAGSAPKDSTFQPDPNGERAPGQPDMTADTTYSDNKGSEGGKLDVQKGVGEVKEDEKEEHQVEIKSATEKEPETAESL